MTIHNSLSLTPPTDLAVENGGSILVVDSGNNRILRISAEGDKVEVVIGTGRPGSLLVPGDPSKTELQTPTQIVLDHSDESIVINDFGNHCVLRLQRNGRLVELVVGTDYSGDSIDCDDPANTALNCPWGIAVDEDRSVLVVDRGNHRVLRIAPDLRSVKCLIGTGEPGNRLVPDRPDETQLRNPNYVFVGPDGSIFVTDAGNHRVLRASSDGSVAKSLLNTKNARSVNRSKRSVTKLSEPGRVVIQSNGSVVITDAGNGRILRSSRTEAIDLKDFDFQDEPAGLPDGRSEKGGSSSAAPDYRSTLEYERTQAGIQRNRPAHGDYGCSTQVRRYETRTVYHLCHTNRSRSRPRSSSPLRARSEGSGRLASG